MNKDKEIKRRNAIREAMMAYYQTERGINHRNKLSRLMRLKMANLSNLDKSNNIYER